MERNGNLRAELNKLKTAQGTNAVKNLKKKIKAQKKYNISLKEKKISLLGTIKLAESNLEKVKNDCAQKKEEVKKKHRQAINSKDEELKAQRKLSISAIQVINDLALRSKIDNTLEELAVKHEGCKIYEMPYYEQLKHSKECAEKKCMCKQPVCKPLESPVCNASSIAELNIKAINL